MLLLITGSYDGTADRLVLSYGENIFRLNYDLWQDYQLAFKNDGWLIRSPSGLEITSDTVSAAYWWKAFSYFTQDDRMVKSEVKYVLRDIYGWCQSRGIAKGNSIDFHNRFGKLTIIGLASKYFSVPKTLVAFNGCQFQEMNSSPVVAKSLSSELSDNEGALMTTEVELDKLDPSYPWYLQHKIESNWDVTVFYCGGNVFPFRRSREGLKGLDWRADQSLEALLQEEWQPMTCNRTFASNLKALSSDLGIDFGRYDFMTIGDTDELAFLEFNANGQWVFLDPFNKHGLLSAVTKWLKA